MAERTAPLKYQSIIALTGRADLQPVTLIGSWIEVALPTERRRPHTLIVYRAGLRRGVGAGRPRAVGYDVRRPFECRVELGVDDFEADIELRYRVPLRARTDLVEAEVRV